MTATRAAGRPSNLRARIFSSCTSLDYARQPRSLVGCRVKRSLLQSPERERLVADAAGHAPEVAGYSSAGSMGSCCSTPNTPHADDANQSSQGPDDNETGTSQCHIGRPEGQ